MIGKTTSGELIAGHTGGGLGSAVEPTCIGLPGRQS
jgi:hypothetical protein